MFYPSPFGNPIKSRLRLKIAVDWKVRSSTAHCIVGYSISCLVLWL